LGGARGYWPHHPAHPPGTVHWWTLGNVTAATSMGGHFVLYTNGLSAAGAEGHSEATRAGRLTMQVRAGLPCPLTFTRGRSILRTTNSAVPPANARRIAALRTRTMRKRKLRCRQCARAHGHGKNRPPPQVLFPERALEAPTRPALSVAAAPDFSTEQSCHSRN